jgi:hypothetical protein
MSVASALRLALALIALLREYVAYRKRHAQDERNDECEIDQPETD